MAGGSKFKKLGQATQATAATSEILSQSQEDVAGYELIQMDKVLPDPKNARRIPEHLDVTQVSDDDIDAPIKRSTIERIHELAASIDSIGMIQPITVKRHGSLYMIVTGHSRFYAHKLLQRQTIRVLVSRPVDSALHQIAENFHRSNLSLPEKIDAIRRLVAENLDGVEKASKKDISDFLTDRVQFGRTRSFGFAALLKAPEELINAIRDGGVISERRAFELARLSREELLEALAAGDDNGLPENSGAADSTSAETGAQEGGAAQGNDLERRRAPGRPMTKFKAPPMEPPLARFLIASIDGEDSLPKIDWNDVKAVGEVFKEWVEKIKKERLK